jgi:DNA-binding response OmpR family regulator
VSAVEIDILLIEDDRRLAELTATYLQQNGLQVAIESQGDLAVDRFRTLRPRLVLLDLMLPGKDGILVCRELRKLGNVPILILTALDTDLNQVVGLEAGADDYVIKPVDPMLLLARVRALLRRATRASSVASPRDKAGDTTDELPADIRLGSLRVSEQSREVWLSGQVVPMTTQEFELLCLLARRAGHPVSRDEVFRSVRGIDYNGLDRSIDLRISKLRRKLGDNADAPSRIKTVWGKGYLLVPDAWGAVSQT